MESSSVSRKRGRGGQQVEDHSSDADSGNTAALLERLIDPNFEELARQFPAFGTAWRQVEATRRQGQHGRVRLSTHITQEFSIALTKALLHVHWGISLAHVPLQHLCPPVPNRFFYVHWIQTVLLPMLKDDRYFLQPPEDQQQNAQPTSNQPQQQKMVDSASNSNITAGLDIGTGAVAIYPLLFCASHPLAHMYATDLTTSESVAMARANVRSNPRLAPRIHVVAVPASDRQQQQQQQQARTETSCSAMVVEEEQQSGNQITTTSSRHEQPPHGALFPVGPLRRSLECISTTFASSAASSLSQPLQQHPLQFCMTNPPFYGDRAEATAPRDGDGRARTAMTSHEGCYPGGEVGFVTDMIVDALYLYVQSHQQNQSTPPPPSPPVWSSTMCGKKSSWIALQHIVTQLLGPGRVCATEFGPGQMTRWFLAWTLHSGSRPSATSPLAHLQPDWNFTVPWPSTSSNNGDKPHAHGGDSQTACAEVVERFREYCRSFPDAKLGVQALSPYHPDQRSQQLRICETTVSPPPWKGDETLPEPIRTIAQTMDPALRVAFLPPEGHFLLDVTVCVVAAATATVSSPFRCVKVQVEAYQHSAFGKKIVEKIKSQLEGEITRTNRRWRRKLQREQKQQQDQTCMDES